MSRTITFEELASFTEKQQEALETSKDHKFTLYGGTMGSGKSYWLRWACIYWLLYLAAKYNRRGLRAGLFCEDYGSLNDRHISKLKFEFPKELGTWNEQRKEFSLHARFGGGIIAFRNLDDPSKYVSSEFVVIAVDEIGRDPYSIFNVLRTRMRWVGIPEVKFLAACNWGGEPWVKRFWYDRNFPPEEQESDQFAYVPALPSDNPHLGEAYYEGLKSLSEAERKVWLENDPNGFESEMDQEGWMRILTDRQLQDSFVEEADHFGDGILGVDPAAGGDRSAIVLGTAHYREVIFSQKLNNVLDLLVPIAKTIERYGNVKQIVIDRTGVGEGLYQRLKELQFPVKGLSFGESATEKEKYYNLKAELYFKEREWILRGGKLKRHQGWNDWINLKYKKYDERLIRIQSKDELRHKGFKSPDVVDAAAMTQYASKNLGFETLYRNTRFVDQTQSMWKNG